MWFPFANPRMIEAISLTLRAGTTMLEPRVADPPSTFVKKITLNPRKTILDPGFWGLK
jgi:hypothetical protein